MERSIRVLHVMANMEMGGLESRTMDLYRHMDRSKVQFDFLVHRSRSGVYDDEIHELGGKIYRVPAITPTTLLGLYQRELKRFFCDHPEYKVVHSHYNALSTFVLRAAREAGVPCRIAHSRTSGLRFEPKSVVKLCSKLFLKQQCTHFFACSEEAGQWLFGDDVISDLRFRVINNAIEVTKYSFNNEVRKKLRTKLGVQGCFVIGHVGSMRFEKNHEFLIQVFTRVYEENSSARLMLIGDGPDKEKIVKLVNGLGLADAVLMLGVRRDVHDLMQTMDLFVLPSHFEGFGTVLVEAQASGLMCIASDTVPLSTRVTRQVEYMSLKSGPSKWAESILKGLPTFDRSRSWKKVVEEGFDVVKVAKDLQRFYIQESRSG